MENVLRVNNLCFEVGKEVSFPVGEELIDITLLQFAGDKYLTDLFYGGLVVTAKYKGYDINIEVVGDVVAHLKDEDLQSDLAYVKDKGNSGRFFDEMSPYVSDDNMQQLIHSERLTIDYGNWFSFYIVKNKEELNSDILDIYNLREAVECLMDSAFLETLTRDLELGSSLEEIS